MAFKRNLTLGEFSIFCHHDGAHAIVVQRKHEAARKLPSCSVTRNLNLISMVLRNRSFMRPGVGVGVVEGSTNRRGLILLVSLVSFFSSLVTLSCIYFL